MGRSFRTNGKEYIEFISGKARRKKTTMKTET
jgi:hypothetical protein